MSINLVYQTSGFTCGPACLKMVADCGGLSFTIAELAALCGATPTEGTTGEGMRRGLDALGLTYDAAPVGDRPAAFAWAVAALEGGRPLVVRSLTGGIKHWFIVRGHEDGNFLVCDPWLGELVYSPEQLDEVWRAREYEAYAVWV
jgi:predicted double-glycine peptidase